MSRRRRDEAGLFVFLAVPLTVACAKTYFVTLFALAAASPASGQTNLGKRVNIDVTGVAPQKVFELLARELECTITVDPAVKKPVTLRVVDMPANQVLGKICQSINCEYRFEGKNLSIKPLSASRRRQIYSRA